MKKFLECWGEQAGAFYIVYDFNASSCCCAHCHLSHILVAALVPFALISALFSCIRRIILMITSEPKWRKRKKTAKFLRGFARAHLSRREKGESCKSESCNKNSETVERIKRNNNFFFAFCFARTFFIFLRPPPRHHGANFLFFYFFIKKVSRHNFYHLQREEGEFGDGEKRLKGERRRTEKFAFPKSWLTISSVTETRSSCALRWQPATGRSTTPGGEGKAERRRKHFNIYWSVNYWIDYDRMCSGLHLWRHKIVWGGALHGGVLRVLKWKFFSLLTFDFYFLRR